MSLYKQRFQIKTDRCREHCVVHFIYKYQTILQLFERNMKLISIRVYHVHTLYGH